MQNRLRRLHVVLALKGAVATLNERACVGCFTSSLLSKVRHRNRFFSLLSSLPFIAPVLLIPSCRFLDLKYSAALFGSAAGDTGFSSSLPACSLFSSPALLQAHLICLPISSPFKKLQFLVRVHHPQGQGGPVLCSLRF